MKKLIAVVLMLLSLNSISAGRYIYGEGRFWADEEDNLVFIKNQLLFNAYINVITKELENMGLDQESFWQKFNTKFEEKFTADQENLKKKYKIEENATAAQKAAYTKALRKLKLEKKRLYMNLGGIIESFAIKKMSKSAVNPQSRFLSLEAKVNKIALNKLFYRLMREKQTSKYEKLFVMLEYELRQTNWTDLGVEGEISFTDELAKAWLKWLNDNKPENIGEIVLVDDSILSDIKDHLRLNKEDIQLHGSNVMKNSLLLINKINMKKEGSEGDENDFKFHYSGGVVLMDLATNRAIFENDIAKREKQYDHVAKDKLSSAIATYVYRLSLDNFSQLNKRVVASSGIKVSKKLTITKFDNISQVVAFKKYLQDFGAKLRIGAELSSFDKEKSEVVVFYQGDDTILMNFLAELKMKSEKSDVQFDFIDPAQPFHIKFIKKRTEMNESEKQKVSEDLQTEV